MQQYICQSGQGLCIFKHIRGCNKETISGFSFMLHASDSAADQMRTGRKKDGKINFAAQHLDHL